MLTIQNCIDYLETMSYENIQFTHEQNDSLYFTAIDEDNQQKEIEFEPNLQSVIVSVKENNKWTILEVLEEN